MWRCTKVWTLCKKHLIINMNGNLYSNWVTIFVLGVGERISLQLEYMGMRKRRMDRPVPMMRVNRAVESPARCLGIKHWICYNVEESWHLGFGHLAHYRPQFHKKEPHTPPPPHPSELVQENWEKITKQGVSQSVIFDKYCYGWKIRQQGMK